MHKYLLLGKDLAPLPTYNLLVGIGLIAFFLVLEKTFRKNAIPFQQAEQVKLIAFFTFAFGVSGSILMEALYHSSNGDIQFSGTTFYGGLVIALPTMGVITYAKRLNFLFVANLLTVPLILAHAFGRIGCFLGGCCYGLPTDSFVGVTYPIGSLPHQDFGNCALHPTQLYESGALFVLVLVLGNSRLENRAISYLLFYSLIRFAIEFYRGDNRGVLWGGYFSPSQEISIGLFLLAVGLFVFKQRNKKAGTRFSAKSKGIETKVNLEAE